MNAAVGLRSDVGAAELRVLASKSKNGNQVRRLLALALRGPEGGGERALRGGSLGDELGADAREAGLLACPQDRAIPPKRPKPSPHIKDVPHLAQAVMSELAPGKPWKCGSRACPGLDPG